MVSKYQKIDSAEYNTYPFKTCSFCGLTYAVMGDNEKKGKKEKKEKRENKNSNFNSVYNNKFLDFDDEEEGSLLIAIDSFDEFSTKELVNESDEFLLADLLEQMGRTRDEYYNENFEHSLYCSRFRAARKKYGKHALTYRERCYIANKLLPMFHSKQAIDTRELLLTNYCEMLFTESLEMVDFSLSHPRFEEFVSLLWNTKWFLEEMGKYFTKAEIVKFRKQYPKNNGLRKNLRWWTASDDSEEFDDDNFESLDESLKGLEDEINIEEFF